MEFDVMISDKCDCQGRYEIRINEMHESIRIIHQCLDKLRESKGDIINPDLPKTIKPPAGEVYSAVESPRGELGFYIVSDGTDTPYRVHARTPSFINLNSLEMAGAGQLIADFVATLGSVDIVLGEVDR
jgi:NADH-quinone oxidoreductase subunit D